MLGSDPMPAFDATLHLLEEVIAPAARSIDRQLLDLSDEHVRRTRAMTAEGGAIALKQGNTAKALELLERGKGIVLGQLGHYRTPLAAVQDVNPTLAERFTTLGSMIEQSSVQVQSLMKDHCTPEDLECDGLTRCKIGLCQPAVPSS